MESKIKKLVIALSLLASTSAHAEWVTTTFDPDTQIDLGYSKRLTDNLVSVWHKKSFPNSRLHNNYFVSLSQYNCKEKTYRLIRYTYYINGQADFINSFTKDYATTPFEDVEPGTYNSKKMIHACQYVK
jgi:hypothetical protein